MATKSITKPSGPAALPQSNSTKDVVVKKTPAGVEYYAIQNQKDVLPPWTNDPVALEEMSDVQDFKEMSSGKIKKPIGVLFHTEEDLYLFADGTTFYVWNPIACVLDQVMEPKDIPTILKKLKEKEGLQALKCTEI